MGVQKLQKEADRLRSKNEELRPQLCCSETEDLRQKVKELEEKVKELERQRQTEAPAISMAWDVSG